MFTKKLVSILSIGFPLWKRILFFRIGLNRQWITVSCASSAFSLRTSQQNLSRPSDFFAERRWIFKENFVIFFQLKMVTQNSIAYRLGNQTNMSFVTIFRHTLYAFPWHFFVFNTAQLLANDKCVRSLTPSKTKNISINKFNAFTNLPCLWRSPCIFCHVNFRFLPTIISRNITNKTTTTDLYAKQKLSH